MIIRYKEAIQRLPNEYQEVDYLESTGVQYIDACEIDLSTVRMVVDVAFTDMVREQNMGSSMYKSGFSMTYYKLGFGVNKEEFGNYFYMVCSSGKSDAIVYTNTGISVDGNIHNFDIQNGSQKLDGIQYGTTAISSLSGKLGLFKTTGNSSIKNSTICRCKIYSCQIYENGTIIRNFVPCFRKSDNEAGLYDLANRVFYTNAGVGKFEIGNSINCDILSPNCGDVGIKKIYVGGTLVYSSEEIIQFDTSPVPTDWDVATSGIEYIQYNEYGMWRIWADNYDASGAEIKKAFDESETTNWSSAPHESSSDIFYMGIVLPKKVSINPTNIKIVSRYEGTSTSKAKLEAYNNDTNIWEELGTIARNSSSHTTNIQVGGNTFYTQFRIKLYRYSSSNDSNYIYDFKITSGTLKIIK